MRGHAGGRGLPQLAPPPRCLPAGAAANHPRQPRRGGLDQRGARWARARTLASWISLSMPRGPSVVRTVSASALQALMLLISWGLP